MRRQEPADDRARCLHALARDLVVPDPDRPERHLGTDDLAALVSGTLFRTECARIENHLLVCEPCRSRAHALNEDYEAGVVPILFRRAVGATSGATRVRRRFGRRWIPWVVGLSAFLIVLGAWSAGWLAFLDSGPQLTERFLVSSVQGKPRRRTASEGPRDVVMAGNWLLPGDHVEFRDGASVEVLDRYGALSSLDEDGRHPIDAPLPLLAAIFERGWEERQDLHELAHAAVPGGVVDDRALRVASPRGLILSDRPSLRWEDGVGRSPYRIRVRDLQRNLLLIDSEVKGRELAWPDDHLPLPESGNFQMEVEIQPYRREPPAVSQFQTLANDRRNALIEQRLALDRSLGKWPRFLRAMWLRQQGLADDAREELEILRQREPSNIAVLSLLKVVYRDTGARHAEQATWEALRNRE
ncbi:MAG: hypothetical protein KDB53_20095 [Planctomycetes bacterium]|nr:hypothetical protein [Planctomycetota bacterium]